MKLVSISDRSYVQARETSRGIVTPEGGRVLEGTPFTGRASGTKLAFVSKMVAPAGFPVPGGTGGAGASEWHDEGEVTPCPSIIKCVDGDESCPSEWYAEPLESCKEDFEANKEAYETAEREEREADDRRQSQKEDAIENTVGILREGMTQDALLRAKKEATNLAPAEAFFGTWSWNKTRRGKVYGPLTLTSWASPPDVLQAALERL